MRPGEISLAHNGVLFLDELPEFHRDVLEALRQPLEDGSGHRGPGRRHPAPARPVPAGVRHESLPAAAGGATPPGKCTCSDREVEKYVQKISGPLLDRIDLHVNVPSVEYEAMRRESPSRNPPLRSRSGWTPPGPSSPGGFAGTRHPLQRPDDARPGRPVLPSWTPGATR